MKPIAPSSAEAKTAVGRFLRARNFAAAETPSSNRKPPVQIADSSGAMPAASSASRKPRSRSPASTFCLVAGDMRDVPVAGRDQMRRRPTGRIAVVDVEHRVAIVADDLVADEGDRHAVRRRRDVAVTRQVAGEEDDAVDLAGEDEARVVRLLLGAVPGVADDHAVAGRRERVLDGVEDRREERVAHAGNQREHDVGRAGAEIAGRGVGRVAGGGDRGDHLRPRLLGDAVGRRERTADGRGRHAGAARDVKDRGRGADALPSALAAGSAHRRGCSLVAHALRFPSTYNPGRSLTSALLELDLM